MRLRHGARIPVSNLFPARRRRAEVEAAPPPGGDMKLEGIHHVTCITGDILRNVDFYTRVLGLRLVAKSVNQDDPSVYHVFYSDEQGAPGADITFFEYKHAARGRPGPGMVHRVLWRGGPAGARPFLGRRAGGGGGPAGPGPGSPAVALPRGR